MVTILEIVDEDPSACDANRDGTTIALPRIMMTTNQIEVARDISDRRLAALQANGEDVRRTASWVDAVAERQQIGRTIAFTIWARR